MEPAEVRPGPHAQLTRPHLVEAAQALGFHQRVAVRAHAVVGLESGDAVPVAAQLLVRLELHERHLERHPADDRAERVEEPAQPGRPVDRQGTLSPAQRERLQHPREPEEVVGMEVGDEDLLEVDQPNRSQELALGALAAVEEKAVATTPHEQRGQPAGGGGRRSGRPDEDHVQVHRPIFARARSAPSTWST